MPRKRKEPSSLAEAGTKSSSALKWVVQVWLPLALGAGMIACVLWVGRVLEERLRDSGGPMIVFTAIECDPPPGLTRREFLEEAQYLAGLPDRLSALEPATQQQIFDALSLHPWVARTRRLEVIAPTVVRAELEYRRPVLVAGPDRVVDGEAVLLPRGADKAGLPRLTNPVGPPTDRAGHQWVNPVVQSAARVAAAVRPELTRRDIKACLIEVRDGEVTLEIGKTRILWGRALGHEGPDEVKGSVKASRISTLGDLDTAKYDLRPLDGIIRTPLP